MGEKIAWTLNQEVGKKIKKNKKKKNRSYV